MKACANIEKFGLKINALVPGLFFPLGDPLQVHSAGTLLEHHKSARRAAWFHLEPLQNEGTGTDQEITLEIIELITCLNFLRIFWISNVIQMTS